MVTRSESGLLTNVSALSLFSGIGGMDLGLENAGMNVIAHSEIEPYACKVLAARWPGVPNLGDITTIDWEDVPDVDVIAGGFPCQDISSARTRNTRQGLGGSKSGLWEEMFRGISAVRPKWVIVENSPEWKRWVPGVRRDLHSIGYASVPLRVSAGSIGAPHRRPRCFVVANANGESESLSAIYAEVARLCPVSGQRTAWVGDVARPVGVGNGIPSRMDRLRCLGNACVPQVAEWIGRRIVAVAA